MYSSIKYDTVHYYLVYCTVACGTILHYSTACCSTVQYYTILFNCMLQCTILLYTVRYSTVLHNSTVCCRVPYCDILYCTILHYSTVCCSVLYIQTYAFFALPHGRKSYQTQSNSAHIDVFFCSIPHLHLPARNLHFPFIKECCLYSLLLWLKLPVGTPLIRV